MTVYADRPSIMAIGDSLYQGVRSLTFTSELARYSPPAQAAAALGLQMTVPNPRIPIAFDLEQLFRQGGVIHLLGDVREVCLKNLEFWMSGEAWSQHEAFDNVAVGGAAISTLYEDTYEQHWATIPALLDRLRNNPSPDAAVIGQLWYALNNCFTLNPQRREAQNGKTQIQQVAERKPALLLVNIGSNEGLFRAAFTGSFDDETFNSVRAIPQKMDELIGELARLPAEVEQIVFNSLIRPRTASNLMPARNQPGAPRDPGYPEDGYFPAIGRASAQYRHQRREAEGFRRPDRRGECGSPRQARREAGEPPGPCRPLCRRHAIRRQALCRPLPGGDPARAISPPAQYRPQYGEWLADVRRPHGPRQYAPDRSGLRAPRQGRALGHGQDGSRGHHRFRPGL
jgi:hypothetical protein